MSFLTHVRLYGKETRIILMLLSLFLLFTLQSNKIPWYTTFVNTALIIIALYVIVVSIVEIIDNLRSLKKG